MIQKCKKCNGVGYTLMPKWRMKVPCRVCFGKGYFELKEGEFICPKCNGERIYFACDDKESIVKKIHNCCICGGDGYIKK